MTSAGDDAQHAPDRARRIEAQRRFFREATHELRTPLQGIVGVVDSLIRGRSGALNDAQRESLTLVYRAALGLAELTDDLLELERLDPERHVMEIVHFDLARLILDVMPLAHHLLRGKDVTLESDLTDSLPEVSGDVKGIQQVLMNLIANAVKFTPHGRIVVRARAGSEFVRIEVEDTGIGIPKEEREAVFAQFHRVGELVSPGYEGAGLGLSICKRIIENHRGEIGVESELGRGSTFWFTVPTAASELLVPDRATHRDEPAEDPDPAAPAAVPSLLDLYGGPEGIATPDSPSTLPTPASPRLVATRGDGEQVLVVDDTPINLAILRDLLEDSGYVAKTASTVSEALAELESGEFDLVITDLWMPGQSGFDLVEKVRDQDRLALTPVLILSARRHKEDIIYGFRLGADDYLPKPFLPEELLARVSGLLRVRRANQQVRVFSRALEEKVEARTRELNEARDQLLLSERMSSLGQLTAGIAHEINNPIGYALSNLDLLASRLDRFRFHIALSDARAELLASPNDGIAALAERCLTGLRELDPEIASDLEEFERLTRNARDEELASELKTFLEFLRERESRDPIDDRELDELVAASRDGLGRVKEIVRELSVFARPKRPSDEGVILTQCLERILAILNNELRDKGIEVTREFDLQDRVRGDGAKLEQVILNLTLNAVQALSDGGHLTVRSFRHADRARIEIEDDGPGIPTEVQDKVFDPFFTTKPVGVGTGLGLSICYRIIEDHGGTIAFESEPGSGTTFKIDLPLSPEASGEA